MTELTKKQMAMLAKDSFSMLELGQDASSLRAAGYDVFLVAGDGDWAGGSSSSYSSGEPYTTSVPDEGELGPIAALQFEGAAIATRSTRSSGGDACRINHVACNNIITRGHSNLRNMCCSPIRREHC